MAEWLDTFIDKLSNRVGRRREVHSDPESMTHLMKEEPEWAKENLKGMSAPELLADVAGGAVGGGAGYLLSKALHRKPDARTRLLYTLLGFGTGAVGTHLGMKTLSGPEGFEGSLSDYLRLKPSYQERKDAEERKKSSRISKKKSLKSLVDGDEAEERTIYDGLDFGEANKAGLVGSISGAVLSAAPSWKGHFVTNLFNNLGQTQQALKDFVGAHPTITAAELDALANNLHNPSANVTIGGTTQSVADWINPAGSNTPSYQTPTVTKSYNFTHPTGSGFWHNLKNWLRSGHGEGKIENGVPQLKWNPSRASKIKGYGANAAVGAGAGYLTGAGLDLLTQALLGQTLNHKNYNPLTDW